jgi:type I restriction enzyme S subunit
MASECLAWDKKPLDDLTESNSPITYGVVKPGEEGEVPFIRGGDIENGRILMNQLRTISRPISEQYRRTLLNGGELLVSLVGNPGQVAIAPPSLAGANIARQVGLVRLRADVDTRFVSYFLRSPVGQQALGAQSLGSVQQVINLRDLKRVIVPLPPLPEQKRIAHILGTLDDKIDLNRRMNATLEGISRAIFKSWFVDFDPVRQRAAGKQPVGMDAQTAALFPDSLEDSEIGESPKGWMVQPISELTEIAGGSTPSTREPQFWEDGVHHWATPKDLSNLTVPVLLDTERRLTVSGVAQITSGLLPIGTVLLSSRAPIGYLAIVETPVAINQGFIAMKPKDGVSNLFLLRWTAASHDEIVSRANGSTFLEISKSNFRPIPAVRPTQAVMDAFHERAFSLFRRVVACERESRSLAALRDTLLPKLLSGELRVPEAEGIVENAVG